MAFNLKKAAHTAAKRYSPLYSIGSSITSALRGTPNKPKEAKSPFTVQSGSAKPPVNFSVPSAPPQVGTTTSPVSGTSSRTNAPTQATPKLSLSDLTKPVTATNKFATPTPKTSPTISGPTANTSGTGDFSMSGYLFPSPEEIAAQARVKEMSAEAERKSSLNTQFGTQSEKQPQTPPPAANIVPGILDALRSKVASLSGLSAEEQKLQDELTSFQESARLGIAGLEGQGRGIPLNLVRGQQAILGEQAGIKEQTLLDRLANATAQRNAQLQAAQMEFEAAKEDQARQDRLTAPLQIGNQILRLNPSTGQFETLYTAPEQPGEAKRYNVGGALVDENGNVIYQDTSSGSSYSNEAGELLSVSEAEALGVPYGTTKGEAYGLSSGKGGADTGPSKLSQDALGLIGNLINHPGLKSATGAIRVALPGSQAYNFNTELERLKSLLSLDNIQYLKGTGAISDREFATLSSAAAALDPKMSTQAFKSELERIQRELQAGSGSSQPPAGWGNDDWQYYLQSGGDPSVFLNDLSTSQNGSSWGDLGSLSEKYESGGNPGAIGYDNTGGYSYGTYQLAHNNALNFINQSQFKDAFKGLKFNSPQWQARWKEIAQKAPQQFAAAQKQYIAKTHFEPQVEKLKKSGINVANLPSVVKDAIWSTAVQHGANTDVVAKAFSRLPRNASPADVLKAIYTERWSGGARFARSTPNVKKAVYNRFFGPQGELAMALKRLQTPNIG